jgi:S1-C subfamily serine protease
MQIEPITPAVARATELPRDRGGAVVVGVERNSAAYNAGLVARDIILEVNRQPVSNVSQVTRALQAVPAGEPVFLVIWRNGQEQFVVLTKR